MKNPHAQALGKLGGLAGKGSPARAESARRANAVRWAKYHAEGKAKLTAMIQKTFESVPPYDPEKLRKLKGSANRFFINRRKAKPERP